MRKGDLVTCPKGFAPTGGAVMHILPPTRDIIYTVRGFINGTNDKNEPDMGVYLEEITNENAPNGLEWAYAIDNFETVDVPTLAEIVGK